MPESIPLAELAQRIRQGQPIRQVGATPIASMTSEEILNAILDEARQKGRPFWWQLPGLEQFGPPAEATSDLMGTGFGSLFLNATISPELYLRMLEEVNHLGNQSSPYKSAKLNRMVTNESQNLNNDRWMHNAWQWLWGLAPYAHPVAQTNVGVAYTQMKAEQAATIAQQQANQEHLSKVNAAAQVQKARETAAMQAGAKAQSYQAVVSKQAIQNATNEAKEAVARLEAPIRALREGLEQLHSAWKAIAPWGSATGAFAVLGIVGANIPTYGWGTAIKWLVILGGSGAAYYGTKRYLDQGYKPANASNKTAGGLTAEEADALDDYSSEFLKGLMQGEEQGLSAALEWIAANHIVPESEAVARWMRSRKIPKEMRQWALGVHQNVMQLVEYVD